MKKLTRQQAINQKCKECNYDSLDHGTWRKQVELCTSSDCSLYEFRPKTTQKKTKGGEVGVSIGSNELCPEIMLYRGINSAGGDICKPS